MCKNVWDELANGNLEVGEWVYFYACPCFANTISSDIVQVE